MKKAKCIMVQGTMSGVGKSLLCAALCRIFRQDGYRAAPFKSQNMALNSYVTRDGLEMGRAQAMQAEAAGLEAQVRMNPVLLKPSSDTGSQVIVHGKVRAHMTAAEYYAYKEQLIPEVMEAFHGLAAEHDIIVIEGAGSPAEINLREHDIVNMGMAEAAGAPVLLAGDIDRGGVFAQLYGTAALLAHEEKSRIEGLVINKFRGDLEILRPGLHVLEEKTGIPILGVVPYLAVDIDDEDSLSPRLAQQKAVKPVDVAVIRLPRISNFTDFAPLAAHPVLGVRYVNKAAALKSPDLIILPGTKNTIDDLLWMRQNGLEAAVQKLASSGVPVLGICGGYQMLGMDLSDPERVEGSIAHVRGMELLPIDTVFTGRKTRTRYKAEAVAEPFADCLLEGYEIHMGQTTVHGAPFCRLENGHDDGCCCGNVFGTYLHGLFDTGTLAERLALDLCRKKGIDYKSVVPVSHHAYAQRQYDILAEGVRRALDMEKVYGIIERYAEKAR